MRRGTSRVDELVATLLPKVALPAHLTPGQLLDGDVVPPAKHEAKVLALRELVRHGGRPDDVLGGRVASSADIAAFYLPRLRDDTMESLHVVGLDTKNHVRLAQCVARGGISTCSVVPRDVLRPVLLNASDALVLVHNHPSGDPKPSAEDIAFTERVVRGAELLGVRVLDHIVIGAHDHFSFRDAGLLPAR
jgi:DNA repair protein RadC